MNIVLPQQHHFLTSGRDVRELCAPLFDSLQASIFVYGKYYPNGECVLLSNNTDWVQHHLEKGYTVPAPLPISMTKKTEGFHVIPEQGSFIQAKYDLLKKFNSDVAVDYIKKEKDFYEIFCLSLPPNRKDANSLLTNNLENFKKFSHIFKEKASPLLKIAERNKILLPTSMRGIDFHEVESQEYDATLTKRQLDCLYNLVVGMTVKENAKSLLLSPRTVEHYLETIKLKLNCYSRAELISKALQFPIIKNKLQAIA